jgi:hypothetical protein
MSLIFQGKNLRMYAGDFRKDGTEQYQVRYKDKDGNRRPKSSFSAFTKILDENLICDRTNNRDRA